METDILIVGGGLAGLSLAATLEAEGRDWYLLEAQPTLGGRIRSPEIGGAQFDLGPAWFWPGQPRMAALVKRLRISVFEQFSAGAQVFEDRAGLVHRHQGYASMSGSLRVEGGMGGLIQGLANALPGGNIRMGEAVTRLQQLDGRVLAHHTSGAISAQRVVLALPPRVAAETIRHEPALAENVMAAMTAVPTWMAGQAKILAVYNRPHWREAGLSGDAASQRGPMVELHDASPAAGGPYAIFGFVGLPVTTRALRKPDVISAARQQLVSLFGPAMADPLAIEMMDWAQAPQISTQLDQAPPSYHPSYGLPPALRAVWDGKLLFGSTEMAREFGGYLEGALEAAERTNAELRANSGQPNHP
jgi:monoamine oxidase